MYTRFNLCKQRLIELDEQNVVKEIIKILPKLCPRYRHSLHKIFPMDCEVDSNGREYPLP